MPGDETDSTSGEGLDADLLDTARRAIHDLFRQGYIDDQHATAALLAIDLGKQRVERSDGPRRGSAAASERGRGARRGLTSD